LLNVIPVNVLNKIAVRQAVRQIKMSTVEDTYIIPRDKVVGGLFEALDGGIAGDNVAVDEK
jgi:adenosine/AMP kinase